MFFSKASFEHASRRGWLFGIRCAKCNITVPKTDYKVEVESSDYGAVKTVTDERPTAIEKWNLRTHH